MVVADEQASGESDDVASVTSSVGDNSVADGGKS